MRPFQQVLLHLIEGPEGPLALLLLSRIALGVAARQSLRPPAAALHALLPPSDPERPFRQLCSIMQAGTPPRF